MPLSRFSYLTAYLLWAVVNLALLLGLIYKLRHHFALLGQAPFWLGFMATLAFFPIFIALIQGQDSILQMFCFAMAFLFLTRRAEVAAGGWLALGLFKFNLVLPFVIPIFLVGRKKLAAGFAAVGVGLLALGLMVTGWRGFLSYPAYVWASESNLKYVWNMPHGNIANLRGMAGALFTSENHFSKNVTLILVSAILLAAVTLCWRNTWRQPDPFPPLTFAVALIASVLLSYHIYVHDLSVLFLAILIVAEFLQGSPPIPLWARRTLYACIAVLFCSPVYLVLTLRWQQLQIMGWVLLALVLVLLKLIGSNGSDATAALPA